MNDSSSVDAIGIETATGFVVLTILDSLNWVDQPEHLRRLQAKLNAYVNFVESGEIWEAYPQAAQRKVVIDVVGKHPIPQSSAEFFRQVATICEEHGIELRTRHCEDKNTIE